MTKPMHEIAHARGHDLSDALLAGNVPVVLRKLAAHWPLVQAARQSDAGADAYLRRFYRDATVGVMLAPARAQDRFFYNHDLSGFDFERAHARLDAVLDELARLRTHKVAQAPAIYVGSTTVDTCLPGLRSDNDIDLGARDALASIWIGNRSCIPAHYDLPDNIAVVAAGRRRFTLFPPEQLANLYIGPLDITPAGQPVSLVDMRAPDLARFPRYAQALQHAQTAELEAGDAIFIPSMWWHHIEALGEFNVLLNYWWRQSPAHMPAPISALMLAFLTLRDLPPAQRQAWQETFRHYIFEADAGTAAHIPPAARSVLAPLDAGGADVLREQILKKLQRPA